MERILLIGILVFLPQFASAGSQVFFYTGSDQSFTVPAGVTSITVSLWGAGAGSAVLSGGAGGYTEGNIAVVGGQALTIIVGQAGQYNGGVTYGGGGNGGTNPQGGHGGSGGGRSAIRLSNGTEMMTAGGGGGGGLTTICGGGVGGGLQGTGTCVAGGGTQQSGGGTGGYPGNSGSQFTGGNGFYSGGGGGGWYGGGSTQLGGTGGGSGYCGGTGVSGCTTTTGAGASGGVGTGAAWTGNPGTHGRVSISWTDPAACTFNGQTIAHGSSVTAYQASSVPFGESCVSEPRTCTDGTLSGSYQYSSCTVADNSPPTTPTITGPTSGSTKTNYTYTFRSTDPDSDTIRYGIDWDNNGSIDEYAPALGYVSSGTSGSAVHSWNSSNTQTFKALAQDSKGATSGWASYTVNMSPNAPTVLLIASPTSVSNGQSSTLTWSSSNATSCTGTNFSTGGATQNTSPGVIVSPTQTTTYTVTCTGPGGTASDSETVTYTCTPVNQCSGNNVVNSCTGAIVQSCSYQCAGGACVPPPEPVFNPDADTTGHLQVRPSLLQPGGRTRVFWSVSNVTTCTASRDNPPPESWTVAGTSGNGWTSSSGSGGIQSGPIVERTTFSLVCTPFAGQTFEPETAVVNIVPVFLEQ